MNKRKIKKVAGILSILGLPAFFLIVFSTAKHHFAELPKFGPRYYDAQLGDTVFHQIPNFELVDHNGDSVDNQILDGKIAVVDFFFTSCRSICPVMNRNMHNIQRKITDPGFTDVGLFSFTVDPETDTPEVLKQYGKDAGADFGNWTFITGGKGSLYELGSRGFFLAAAEDVMAPGGFLHSEKLVLLDRERHIRGFYDGTVTEEVEKLVDDLKMLLKEEKIKKRDAKESK